MKDEIQKQELEEKLMYAGVFHPDEVEINEAGYLSVGQKLWLVLEASFWFGMAGLEISLAASMWVFYFIHPYGSLLSISLIWGVVLVIFASVCAHSGKMIIDEQRDNQVKMVSGTLFKRFSLGNYYGARGGQGGHCNVEIHNQLFSISPSTYDAIAEGRSYRLFYLPKSRTLVNIVPLVNS